MSKLNTLGNVTSQTLNASLKELLLILINVGKNVDQVLGTIWTKLNWNREEIESSSRLDSLTTWSRGVNERWLNDALLALSSSEDLLGETVSGVSHREGGGTKSLLSLDDLITAELDAVDEDIELVSWDLDSWLGLGEEWDDGLAGVAADDWDGGGLWVGGAGEGGDKGLGADDVEGGDTEEALWVEDALGLEDLSGDWDGGVHWVGDDEDEGVWCDVGDGLDEALDDAGVDVEEIITGHSWLAWNSGWDNNDIGILESELGSILLWQVAGDFSAGGDVGEISGNTWGVDNIVESELIDERAGLEEEGQWLSNSSRCTSDNSLDHVCGL